MTTASLIAKITQEAHNRKRFLNLRPFIYLFVLAGPLITGTWWGWKKILPTMHDHLASVCMLAALYYFIAYFVWNTKKQKLLLGATAIGSSWHAVISQPGSLEMGAHMFHVHDGELICFAFGAASAVICSLLLSTAMYLYKVITTPSISFGCGTLCCLSSVSTQSFFCPALDLGHLLLAHEGVLLVCFAIGYMGCFLTSTFSKYKLYGKRVLYA